MKLAIKSSTLILPKAKSTLLKPLMQPLQVTLRVPEASDDARTGKDDLQGSAQDVTSDRRAAPAGNTDGANIVSECPKDAKPSRHNQQASLVPECDEAQLVGSSDDSSDNYVSPHKRKKRKTYSKEDSQTS